MKITSIIKIIKGNLLTTDTQYIAHQCNCISKRSAHLSKDMFEKFPYADVYTGRIIPNELGTIKICGNGQDQRYVINMFGQYFPGTCKYPNGSKDNPKLRENSFQKCLEQIEKINNLKEIAFPYQIGCGAAGGNWIKYETMINEFATKLFPFTEVFIIRL